MRFEKKETKEAKAVYGFAVGYVAGVEHVSSG